LAVDVLLEFLGGTLDMITIIPKLRSRLTLFAEKIWNALVRSTLWTRNPGVSELDPVRHNWPRELAQIPFLAIIVYWFRHTPPPEYAIGLFALETFLISLMGMPRKKLERVGWILIAVALIHVDVLASSLERKEVDAARARDTVFFQQEFQRTGREVRDAHVSADAVSRIDQGLVILKSDRAAIASLRETAATLRLKIEALELTRDIYGFVGQRRGAEPRFTMPELTTDHEKFQREWYAEVNENKRQSEIFDAETVREYSVNYSVPVTTVASRLRELGLWKSQACDFADNPSSYILCASKIESAAQELR
jgi:hypothetical protein